MRQSQGSINKVMPGSTFLDGIKGLSGKTGLDAVLSPRGPADP
jgi:hypothetical protein